MLTTNRIIKMKQIPYISPNGNITTIPAYFEKVDNLMAKLVNEDCRIAGVRDIMQQRLRAHESGNSELIKAWNNYISTGDSIVNNPYDDTISIVLNSPSLRSVNPKSRFVINGRKFLEEEELKKIQGIKFPRKEAAQHLNKDLKFFEAIRNPIWFAFSGNDQDLLERYSRLVFPGVKNKPRLMDIMFNSAFELGFESQMCFSGSVDNDTFDCSLLGISMQKEEYVVTIPKYLEERIQ